MSDFFNSLARGMKEYARSSRTADGRSTLHLAVLTNTASPIQTLLDAGVDRCVQDRGGNTALHLASSEGADISLRTLLTYHSRVRSDSPIPTRACVSPHSLSDIVDIRNTRGETALHLACKANSISCIKVLLSNSSDLYIMTPEGKQPVHYAVRYDSVESASHILSQDTRLAHTDSNNEPLIHLAKSKEMVDLLVRHGVDTTLRDSTGNTVLHSAIINKNYQLLMALLLSGGPIDQLDSTGNTALHTAVYQDVERIYAKTLVVFGIKLEQRNDIGKTAYEVAVDGEKSEYVELLSLVGGHDAEYLSRGDREPRVRDDRDLPRPRPNWGPRDAAVLCVDGGGIKGLAALQILLEIEKITQCSIVDLFDWVAGSSIGSLLVLALKHAKIDNTMRGMQRVLFDLKNKAFEGSRPYRSDVLEEIVQDIMGSETKMLDSLFPRVIVTTTLGDVRPCQLHLFTNYKSEDEFVWKVARASGAAPTYFSPFQNKYLDGGVMSNNPTLDTLVEMRQYYNKMDQGLSSNDQDTCNGESSDVPQTDIPGDSEETTTSSNETVESFVITPHNPALLRDPCIPKIVISVGTGLIKTVEVRDLDVGFRPRNPLEAARFANSAFEMFNMLVEQCALCDGPIVEQSRYWCDSVGSEYYRLQPDLPSQTAMDEKRDIALVQMCWETCCWIYKKRKTFRMLSDALYSGT